MRWLPSVTLVVALCGPVHGAGEARHRASPFALDPWVDGTAMALGLTLWIGAPLMLNDTRATCDPCDPRELNALDRPVIHFRNERADTAGDVLVVAIPTLAAAGTLLGKPRWGMSGVAQDVVLIAESMVLAGAVTQIVKLGVRRARPYMYEAGARPDERGKAGATLSFFSGHSASAFSAATAFAYTFSVRHPRSNLRPLVWLAALVAASTVPVMRVASGEHFWTDVMVGAVVGGGVGILVPALHRRASTSSVRMQLTPTWAGLTGSF